MKLGPYDRRQPACASSLNSHTVGSRLASPKSMMCCQFTKVRPPVNVSTPPSGLPAAAAKAGAKSSGRRTASEEMATPKARPAASVDFRCSAEPCRPRHRSQPVGPAPAESLQQLDSLGVKVGCEAFHPGQVSPRPAQAGHQPSLKRAMRTPDDDRNGSGSPAWRQRRTDWIRHR